MDAHIRKFLTNTSINCRKAIVNNDPKLTLAVLVNLQSVLDGYVQAAQDEYNQIPRVRKASK